MDDRGRVVARIGLPVSNMRLMESVVTDLDAETLRRCLRLGGLDVAVERAALLLPVAAALLAGCDRLATLDLASPGGCGPEDGQGD
jgi:hypothetical protein